MRESCIFKKDFYKRYANAFNDSAMNILYGSNVVMGSDIEDEWKDVPADDD